MWPVSQYSVMDEHQNQRHLMTIDRTSGADIEKTNDLKESFVSYEVVPTKLEIRHRMKVLTSLHRLVKQWIQEQPLGEDVLLTVTDTVKGNIYTFGSNKFEVHHRVANICALCLAPRQFDRTDYFRSFFELLQSQPRVKDLRSAEETFVPVMKIKFDGIAIGLMFTKLALEKAPDSFDLSDDTLSNRLNNLVKLVRFLNERRVMNENICSVSGVLTISPECTPKARPVRHKLLVSDRILAAKRKIFEINPAPSASTKKTRRHSKISTNEVSKLSHNENSNSSNMYEVNTQNGTSETAPGTSRTRVSRETTPASTSSSSSTNACCTM